MHDASHPLAGKTVILNEKAQDPHRGMVVSGAEFRIDDWVDHAGMGGKSWMTMDGNISAMLYGMRAGLSGLPTDNEVVYGHIGALGHMVHVSELGNEKEK